MSTHLRIGVDTESEAGHIWCVGVADNQSRTATKDWRPLVAHLQESGVIPVFHNAGWDLAEFRREGVEWGDFEDTILKAHLLGHHPLGLKALTPIFTGVQLREYAEVVGTGKKAVPMDAIAADVLAYCSMDGWATYRLNELFPLPPALQPLYAQEKLLVRLIMDMKAGGLPLDQAKLRRGRQQVLKRMAQLEPILRAHGIEEPTKAAAVAQRFWKGKPKKVTTKTGELSTAAEVLRTHATPADRPWVDALLEWRQLSHFEGTYLAAWKGHEWLHPSLNQTGAMTWRFSCSDPNLQNVPKSSLVSLYGLFVAPEGYAFISADYSQLELRVLANMTKDPAMLEAYASGRDLHAETTDRLETMGLFRQYGITHPDEKRRFAKCFHPDTEVLTRRGWSRIPDLLNGEEVVQAIPGQRGDVYLEWAVPLEHYTTAHPSRQLVHLRNHGMNLRVTPDHRMLAWQTDDPRVVLPQDMAKQRRWANAGIMDDGNWMPDETLLRLAVATEADGTFSGRRIRFGFYNARKIARLNSLVPGLQWTDHRNGQLQPVASCALPRDLSTQVKALLTSDKQFPWTWLSLTPNLRGIVLDELQYWDGGVYGKWKHVLYTSGHPQSRNVVQAMASITGRKSQYHAYGVCVTDHATTRGGNLKTTLESYEGPVACISVPSTFVLVRDGGVSVIAGQTITFGIAYGSTAYGLAPRLKLSNEGEAQLFIDGFYDTYRGIRPWQQSQIEFGEANGYVETFKGRPLYVPCVLAERGRLRYHGEKQCMNFPIQGGAAEIVKDAMLRAPQYLRMQVHDELLYLVPKSEAAEYKRFLAATLVDNQHQIPYTVDIKVGDTWGDLKTLTDIWVEADDDE